MAAQNRKNLVAEATELRDKMVAAEEAEDFLEAEELRQKYNALADQYHDNFGRGEGTVC
jgi:hypothetical protein